MAKMARIQTAIYQDVRSGFIPERYVPYLRQCIDAGEDSCGYVRRYEEYATRTDGLTIEFLWHTHDGYSGRRCTDLLVDYKRNGKYL